MSCYVFFFFFLMFHQLWLFRRNYHTHSFPCFMGTFHRCFFFLILYKLYFTCLQKYCHTFCYFWWNPSTAFHEKNGWVMQHNNDQNIQASQPHNGWKKMGDLEQPSQIPNFKQNVQFMLDSLQLSLSWSSSVRWSGTNPTTVLLNTHKEWPFLTPLGIKTISTLMQLASTIPTPKPNQCSI